MPQDTSDIDGPSLATAEELRPDDGRQSAPQEDHTDDLLDMVVAGTVAARERETSDLDRFLAAGSNEEALAVWLLRREDILRRRRPKDAIIRLLNADIAKLDELINEQINAILHHPRLQKLEASWRGLRFLVQKINDDDGVRVRVMPLTWKELAQDVTRAIEFDQSQLFHKIYSEEFGTAGGEPYGVLLGDYEFRHRVSREVPDDGLEVLKAVSHVAAAAFCPFIAGAHPSFFGLDTFSELDRPMNLPRTFEQIEYIKWKALRDSEDSRFVGLTMPRVIMRLPYRDDSTRVDRFRFHEDVSHEDQSRYLWGTAIYAFGSILCRAFAECGWLAEIRGVRQGLDSGGVVTGLPSQSFETDVEGLIPKYSTDAQIPDDRDKELGELGFIPLCGSRETKYSAFYGNQSIQRPKKYDEAPATINARMSAMLQYMLCVARFAHYLKVLGRDKLGSFAEASEFENYLQRWLQKYVTSDDDASQNVKAQYPLREANIQLKERPGKPGNYVSVIHLRPHFQLDDLVASVKLVTELSSAQAS